MYFTEEYMLIKHIHVERMYDRLIQNITLESPETNTIFTFSVIKSINLYNFERGQKVVVGFKMFKRWNTNGGLISITSIEPYEE